MAASMWKSFHPRTLFRKILFPVAERRVCVYSTKSNSTDKVLSVDSLFSDADISSKSDQNSPDSVKDNVSKIVSDLNLDTSQTKSSDEDEKSFATYLRESRFMQLGDLKNKLVSGRITDVQGNDLYIDFGGKFGCVCPRPSYQSEKYIRGAYVKLNLNKFEMTSKFLGNEQHVTLLEADCTLLGMFSSPSGPKTASTDTPESKTSES